MRIEQIYTGCLAHGAYLIESQGEVAIVDPLREVQPYIEKANKIGAKIKYIFETHFHADFVSGHLTLAEQTGAPIIYGPSAKPNFEAIIAEDNQTFPLGNIQIKVLHTPGHTMESSTFLLFDEEGKEHCIFSGDTLFLGDVGRPDLAQKATGMDQFQLAELLYESLRNKIMPLPDKVIVYPGHGAGSACGKNMMTEIVDTLGNQKRVNYALRADMDKEEFVKEVTDGLLPPPAYFPMNAQLNKMGYESIDEVLSRGENAMSPEAFELAANELNALILDVRTEHEFENGHIPRSIFIGLNGNFAPWVGSLIKDVKQNILLVAHEDQLEEAVTRLARIGFDQTLGYLEGGFEAWQNAGKKVDWVYSVSAEEFAGKINEYRIFDVRKESEFKAERLEGAVNTPLDFINDHLPSFPKDHAFYIYCAGGYRSIIAASILKSRGFHNMINVRGGIKAIKEAGMSTTDYVCQKELK